MPLKFGRKKLNMIQFVIDFVLFNFKFLNRMHFVKEFESFLCIKEYCPGVPTILVGTKLDLRTDNETIEHLRLRNMKPVTREQGEAMAKKIGAKLYHEVASITYTGVDELFSNASELAVYHTETSPSCIENCKCIIIYFN